MMKTKKVEVEIVENEGLGSLMGEKVLILCANYFYTGVLDGVNDTCILLSDPSLVYETGPWSDSGYKDAQKLPNDLYIQVTSIEAFGLSK